MLKAVISSIKGYHFKCTRTCCTQDRPYVNDQQILVLISVKTIEMLKMSNRNKHWSFIGHAEVYFAILTLCKHVLWSFSALWQERCMFKAFRRNCVHLLNRVGEQVHLFLNLIKITATEKSLLFLYLTQTRHV